jgi:cardiolipin synthase A/B
VLIASLVVAIAVVVVWLGIVALATPTVVYRLDRRFDLASREFESAVANALGATLVRGNTITRLDNGSSFYPQMLADISSARHSIALECYILHPDATGESFIAALVERARAGVQVRVVLDAIGSRRLRRRQVQPLIDAGGDVAWHPRARWRRVHWLTNSTHRELLVVDGRVAFTGGAGISDLWAAGRKGRPPWRDTMFRVEGPLVASIQAVFAENWVECRGDILAGEKWFPFLSEPGTTDAAVLTHSPSFSRSRAMFQALIECASTEIRLTTPYFVPDPSFMSALIERARSGVAVTILLPGPNIDHGWVRLSSRRLFRPLLDAGIRLFEYQPAMIHQKLMIVDGLWSVVGTTNLDMLSFEYLDEINLAVRDAAFAAAARAQHDSDLASSLEVNRWSHRPAVERALAWAVWTVAGQRWVVRLRRRIERS